MFKTKLEVQIVLSKNQTMHETHQCGCLSLDIYCIQYYDNDSFFHEAIYKTEKENRTRNIAINEKAKKQTKQFNIF